jgi:two-component system CheB/CheR fusion protein
MANKTESGGKAQAGARKSAGQSGRELPPVVGVGASAGGITAYKTFVANIPSKSGIAWVLIQHMAPDRESSLASILQRETELPLTEVTEEVAVEADHVYLIAPGETLTINEGKLQLATDHDRLASRTSIDAFLLSLAAECGEHCGCALLSGTGTDGTLGLKAVKEAGGLTLTQALGTAEYDSMLLSAVRTGLVDRELPVGDMPEEFTDFLVRARDGRKEVKVGEGDRERIYRKLHQVTGHDFSGYKANTVDRRIRRRMQMLGTRGLKDYLSRLDIDKEESTLLFRDLLIGVTQFFRDPKSFDVLADKVLPKVLEKTTSDDEVRIWVPGCSTGEEVYSLAMQLQEKASDLDNLPVFRIFGSDIDENALHVARTGRYPQSIAADVSQERLDRFFEKEDGTYVIRKPLREMCLFAQHNVLRDPPFSRINLISCRNLLIYMNPDLQRLLVPVFHYALRPGGFLFLGPAEGANHHPRLFKQVDRKNRIYQKSGDSGRMPDFPLASGHKRAQGEAEPERKPSQERQGVGVAASRRILSDYAPAYVVIDEHYEIHEVSGATGAFLELPRGKPRANLVAMAREGLAIDIKAAVSKVLSTGKRTVRENLVAGAGEDRKHFTLTVEPIQDEPGAQPLYLVVFQERAPVASSGKTRVADDDVTRALEQELQSTKERLQTTMEELETSNEELKASNEELSSVNEELQSSNEELETSKEELQSINEELRTVNSELNSRVEDLSQANNDLKNLFANTQIAMLFLDRDHCIMNFTPAAKPLFRLRDHDTGRPLDELAGHIDNGQLKTWVGEVLDHGEPFEREIHTKVPGDGDTFLMRIQPYKGEEDRTCGAVLTFIDITERKHQEERLSHMVSELNHRVKNTLAGVLAVVRQTRGRSDTIDEFAETVEGRVLAMARAHNLLSDAGWQRADLYELMQSILSPFAEPGGPRLSIEGPSLEVNPEFAVTLGLVLHELATNASKYGAWSKAGRGKVEVSWVYHLEDGTRLSLAWRENGGPQVSEPAAHGFGMQFISHSVEAGLAGKFEADFREDGLQVRFEIPGEGISRPGQD